MTSTLKLLSALAMGLALVHPALAEAEPPRIIAVSGEGSVSAKPNIARVRIGVQNRAESADAALAANSAAMKKLFQTLDRFGVGETDRRTSGLSLSPVYGRPVERGAQRPVEGFTVSNQAEITVREFDKLGTLLRDLVAGGANTLSGVGFEVDPVAPLLERARRLAIQNAKARAELYADEAGVAVGRVLEITEGAVVRPGTVRHTAARALAESVPVAPGEQEIRASVSVTFEVR